jgi:hypothetical protein
MTFFMKISEGTIMSGNLIERHGSSGHMTLDDAQDNNDSIDEGVITDIKYPTWHKVFGNL